MEKEINHLLDVHTHRPIETVGDRAIVNCRITIETVAAAPAFVSRWASSRHLSVGIHPWEPVEQEGGRLLDALYRCVEQACPVAIGEAGLDKLATAPMEWQQEMFVRQVELSEQCRLPLIVHCVRAMDELLALKKRLAVRQPWVWHGFRGKAPQAEQLLRKDFYLSFGEHFQEQALRAVPADRLLLETDESRLPIEEILNRAARVRGVPPEVLQSAVCENIHRIFGAPDR